MHCRSVGSPSAAARRSWVLRGVEGVAEEARTRGFASLTLARFALVAKRFFASPQNLYIRMSTHWVIAFDHGTAVVGWVGSSHSWETDALAPFTRRSQSWTPYQREDTSLWKKGNRTGWKPRLKLQAVKILLGHTKLESTVRHLGIEPEDALEIAEGTDA